MPPPGSKCLWIEGCKFHVPKMDCLVGQMRLKGELEMKRSSSKQRAPDGSPARAIANDHHTSSADKKKFHLAARIAEPRLQKALLRLHAAMETEEVITAVFDLMEAAVPSRYIGVWFQVLEPEYKYPRILRFKPAIAISEEQLNRGFETTPAAKYFATHPGVKIWRNRDAFTDTEWRAMDFYVETAQPMDFHYTANVGVWKGTRLLGGTTAMRS